MPESKAEALKRAKRLGFPASSVVKGNGGYFIAPHGVTTAAGKRAYAECRAKGGAKEKCARIAHDVDDKAKK